MHATGTTDKPFALPNLSVMPTAAKALITAVILTLGIGMFGALGQIIIHDIIPTFFQETEETSPQHPTANSDKLEPSAPSRGDLFSAVPAPASPKIEKPFYHEEQFVWTLKWTHIHLFGMNFIFILMGTVALFLDLPPKAKTWIVALPFAGVLIDIAAMWLKGFVSPHFFWLHVPGGMMFALIFLYVAAKAIQEMWFSSSGE